jgi:hypothetical protein
MHARRARIRLGLAGARGPGKSHAVFAQVALDDCRRRPGLKALYLRKALKQAREQFDDLRRRVLRGAANEFNRSAGVGDAVGREPDLSGAFSQMRATWTRIWGWSTT